MIVNTFAEFDELEALTDITTNGTDAIGDNLQEKASENITRVYCQNINGLSWDSEGGKWPYICDAMAGIHTSIACFTETNTDTNNFTVRTRMEKLASRQFNHSRLIMATSKRPTSTMYKPGGTAILATDAITAMISSHSRDRMGRWSSIRLTTSTSQNIRIIAAYQVCKNLRPGTNTAAAQQRAQIIEEHALNTHDARLTPRESFIGDLQAFIQQSQANGDNIILLGDFNEEINTPSSGMERLASTCGLADLFSIRLGSPSIPATYQRGSKRLDYALLSPTLLAHVSAAGYDPFGYRIPSDHRGFFIDFFTDTLFSHEITPLDPPEKRDFSSKTPGVIARYVTAKTKYLQDHRFFERLEQLEELSHPDPILAEALDRDFQRAAIHAGLKCARRKGPPWSPKLAASWAKLHYYGTLKSAKATNKDCSSTINSLVNQWEHLPRQISNSDDDVREGYNRAMQKLREARQQAQSLQEEYLAQKVALYESLEKKGKVKIIERLIRAESQKQVHKKIEYIRNQDGGKSGLSTIKVPKTTI